MRKLTAKWVPRSLSIDQKCQRVCDSKSFLDLFNCNPSGFLRQLVTIDGTWIYYYSLDSKQQAKLRIETGTALKRADTTIG